MNDSCLPSSSVLFSVTPGFHSKMSCLSASSDHIYGFLSQGGMGHWNRVPTLTWGKLSVSGAEMAIASQLSSPSSVVDEQCHEDSTWAINPSADRLGSNMGAGVYGMLAEQIASRRQLLRRDLKLGYGCDRRGFFAGGRLMVGTGKAFTADKLVSVIVGVEIDGFLGVEHSTGAGLLIPKGLSGIL